MDVDVKFRSQNLIIRNPGSHLNVTLCYRQSWASYVKNITGYKLKVPLVLYTRIQITIYTYLV